MQHSTRYTLHYTTLLYNTLFHLMLNTNALFNEKSKLKGHWLPLPVLNPTVQICEILHGVLTISSVVGRFEQYWNETYPKRQNDKKKLKKNNWPCMTWIGLAQYITDLTLLEITPLSSDISQYCQITPDIAPILPNIAPILPNIAQWRLILPHTAQNMGPFNGIV